MTMRDNKLNFKQLTEKFSKLSLLMKMKNKLEK